MKDVRKFFNEVSPFVMKKNPRDIGFTGTQNGMTYQQKVTFHKLINELRPKHFRHGDCIGADEDAHDIVLDKSFASIFIYPPSDPKKRAYCSQYTSLCKPQPYLTRNRSIVDASDMLIACPATKAEQLRSGTWATVRYARKQGKPVTIILPDGRIQ